MRLLVLFTVLFVLTPAINAQSLSKASDRTGTWEFGLSVNHLDSWDLSGREGSSLDVDSDTGWGFSIGYNFNEHFNLGFEFAHNSQSYDARIVPDQPAEDPFNINYELSNDNYGLNFTYNILAKDFTPFINGGVGWNYIDSNVSDSDIDVVCWYDPWWGYICDSYFSTYTDTSFSYNVGAGVRWQVGRNFILRASVNQRWIDFDGASDTPEIFFSKIDFVWRM